MEAIEKGKPAALSSHPDAWRLERTRQRVGVLFALACAVNAAFVPAVAKITTADTDGLSVAFFTTAIAALTASGVLGARGQWRALLVRKQWARLAALGVLGTGASFFLFYVGAKQATATETVLCLQIEPVYSLLLAWLVLGHAPTARRVAATALILAGIALALGVSELPSSRGVWFLLATPLCWQVSHLIVLCALPLVPAEVLTAARYVWGAIALLALWAPSASLASFPPLHTWPWLVLQGVVLSYCGTMLWYAAVRRIDLARATVLVVPTVPLLALLVSFALLAETPTLRELFGVGLAVLGVFAFATEAPRYHPTDGKPPGSEE